MKLEVVHNLVLLLHAATSVTPSISFVAAVSWQPAKVRKFQSIKRCVDFSQATAFGAPLPGRLANDQNGYFRVGQNLKSLATKQDALDTTASVRRHHNQFRF